MWIFGSTINKVTIYYVIAALAFSGLLAPLVTETKTNSEAFFVILLTLDLFSRTWKMKSKRYFWPQPDKIFSGLFDNLKKALLCWLNPVEGAHILFIPSWCFAFIFIIILRNTVA